MLFKRRVNSNWNVLRSEMRNAWCDKFSCVSRKSRLLCQGWRKYAGIPLRHESNSCPVKVEQALNTFTPSNSDGYSVILNSKVYIPQRSRQPRFRILIGHQSPEVHSDALRCSSVTFQVWNGRAFRKRKRPKEASLSGAIKAVLIGHKSSRVQNSFISIRGG